jgi:large subunit ribosomal protein L31
MLCMKTDIHPKNYRMVIFKDVSSGAMFLIGSTVDTKETATWTDGKEYPLFTVEISSKSHPFYTGQDKALDTAGRAEKFKARVAKKAAVKK